ncbi:MAG: threonine synthase [Chloroflexi bacterium]|nr:threonine synthase [Chloroflexota bacterium]
MSERVTPISASQAQLICSACRAAFALESLRWRCDCGGLLDIAISPRLDLDTLRQRPPTLWRYREAIPVRDERHVVSLGEGVTPLASVAVGGRELLVKQDQLFPSGSYKDRGAAVLVSAVRAAGVRHVVEDSSGNAGAAIAAYCARAGIACDIYVPEGTSAAKLAQIELSGARLVRVPGNREDTARAVWQAAQGAYYASHSWNPFFLHGTKTWAYEVCEQLGWRAPDAVALPVGNGTLLLGADIGFRELEEMGLIPRVPRLIAIQAANCAPLYRAFREGRDSASAIERSETVAEGIAIAAPVRGSQILSAVRRSGGEILAVGEAEIVDELRGLLRQGYCVEPTAAATIAGARAYLRAAADPGLVVSTLTGHGLKAMDKLSHLL